MSKLDYRFQAVYYNANLETLEHVSERTAVVEFFPPSDYQRASWACIDKDFGVGYVFAYSTNKEAAVQKCRSLEEANTVSPEDRQAAVDFYDKLNKEDK